MNRRGFLLGLGGAAAALAAGELLLPKRTFFLPPRGGWPVYGRHFSYQNFYAGWQEWRWASEPLERYRPIVCSAQNAEWEPMGGPDLVTQSTNDLFDYATGPREGPLNLDIIIGDVKEQLTQMVASHLKRRG